VHCVLFSCPSSLHILTYLLGSAIFPIAFFSDVMLFSYFRSHAKNRNFIAYILVFTCLGMKVNDTVQNGSNILRIKAAVHFSLNVISRECF
jgi:hypothetical protein